MPIDPSPIDPWLPMGFELAQGLACGRALFDGPGWQIVELTGRARALLTAFHRVAMVRACQARTMPLSPCRIPSPVKSIRIQRRPSASVLSKNVST